MARSILQFGQINVKYYGAVGDGSADDTSAISAAIDAIPASGGLLIFPPGTYKTSGGFTLANPTTVCGFGKAGFDGTTGVSKITCTSQTASLFTVTAYYAKFEDIGLVNTYAGTPSAGAGITVAGSTLVQRVDFESISVSGFYIDVDVQVGCSWVMHNCWIYAPVLYGLKIRNTQNADAGDWSISDSNFFSATYDATAGIYIGSSGGGKINNVKINMGVSPYKNFTYGIEVAPAGSTVILLLSNSSIENTTSFGFYMHIDGQSWDDIIISNCEFGVYRADDHAIDFSAATLHELDNVIISGCVLHCTSGNEAISLTKIGNASIGGNVFAGYSGILAQSGCENVVVYGPAA